VGGAQERSGWLGRRRAPGVLLAVLLVAVLAIVPAAEADAKITTKSKASVAAAYNSVLVPALATPTDWTGDVASCSVGSESEASRQATLTAINFVRELAGLKKVRLDPVYSAKAQAAALVYSAENNLSHDIPPDWKCYSADARAAGAKSNIAWGSDDSLAGAKSVIGYMDDAGIGNEVVGHRRWILNPRAITMGTGSTRNTNALWVQGKTSKKAKGPDVVGWPSAGYFPSQLEPDGRWSASAPAQFAYDFSKAKVSVTTASGKRLPVKKYKPVQGYANDTISFRVSGLTVPRASTAVATYTVKVSGVRKAGSKKKLTYSYKVKLFDPTS
jgi:uncharacterized protein YkwD